jgi:hypothetical protein
MESLDGAEWSRLPGAACLAGIDRYRPVSTGPRENFLYGFKAARRAARAAATAPWPSLC